MIYEFMTEETTLEEDYPSLSKLQKRINQLIEEKSIDAVDVGKIKHQLTLNGKPTGIFGVVVEKFPITSLRSDGPYNRNISTKNVNDIANSIDKAGYFMYHYIQVDITTGKIREVDPITGEIIDGQHSVLAAIAKGLTHLPVILLSFSTEEQKVDFYIDSNKWQKKLNKSGELLAQARRGEALATTIYRLYNHEESEFLYRRIKLERYIDLFTNQALTGPRTNVQTTFTASQMEAIITVCLFNSNTEMKKVNRDRVNRQLILMEFTEIAVMADFIAEMYIKTINITQDSIIRGFLSFYILAAQQQVDFSLAKDRGSFIAKMEQTDRTKLFNAGQRAGIIEELVVHFNRGKYDENKIKYNREIK